MNEEDIVQKKDNRLRDVRVSMFPFKSFPASKRAQDQLLQRSRETLPNSSEGIDNLTSPRQKVYVTRV
jgi:hypothetical protein